MAYGAHWEWRGFGGVSGRFARQFINLPPFYESQQVEDLYLWAPGLTTNIKFRTGAEDGLKFKRLLDKQGEIEKWMEDTDEIFDFPLEQNGWNLLREVLRESGIALPQSPSPYLDRAMITKLLTEAGCQMVKVTKLREARIWHGEERNVSVEWAVVSEPQPVVSIGLENITDEEAEKKQADASAIENIRQFVRKTGLAEEPLKVMSYMKAIEIWAEGDRI